MAYWFLVTFPPLVVALAYGRAPFFAWYGVGLAWLAALLALAALCAPAAVCRAAPVTVAALDRGSWDIPPAAPSRRSTAFWPSSRPWTESPNR